MSELPSATTVKWISDFAYAPREVELRHAGLQKYRVIRGRDKRVVQEKANAQIAAWDSQWNKRQAREKQLRVKQEERQERQEAKEKLQRLKQEERRERQEAKEKQQRLKQAARQERQEEKEKQQRLRLAEQRKQERANEAAQKQRDTKLAHAEMRTEEARADLERLRNLLSDATKRNPTPDFEKLKNRERFERQEFSKPQPEPPKSLGQPKLRAEPQRPPSTPHIPPRPLENGSECGPKIVIPPRPLEDASEYRPKPVIPPKPSADSPKYRPAFSILDKLFQSRKEQTIMAAKALYEADVAIWEQRKKEIEDQYAADSAAWERNKRALHEAKVAIWEQRKKEIEEQHAAELTAWKKKKAALHEAKVTIWELSKKVIEEKHAADLVAWEQKKTEIEKQNAEEKLSFEARIVKTQAAFEKRFADWRQKKDAFDLEQLGAAESFKERQKKFNDGLKELEKAYLEKTPNGIIGYCRLILSQSEYPKKFPRRFELEYVAETKLLLVEYSLPVIDVLPSIVEVNYLPTKDEFKEVFLSDSALKKLYDDVLYQITLRSLHELFKADRAKALDSVVFNGWVHGLNKATGKKVNTCVLSVHTRRDAFLDLDLKNVDPKACFKLLKGVGSSELHGLAAVAPIMRIDKKDKRFVEAYGVAGELDGAVNLAAMDWEDFEHLVRELFEKEFAQYGGEVKITQASRDGGVDAVAFDPDPIRGGKIVIQAKRYTNVVGLSAVRDLYGTVVNEGAIKGILVTTAAYGPDAYEFAKDKPLTLLNGSNLLHMLERHGHKAKIDLRDAKRILAEETRK
jgi:restriction system protein